MYKKISTIFLIAFMALAIPMQSNAMNLNDSTIVVENVAASRSAFLINRMNEIRMMDKSTLNSLEKKWIENGVEIY